MLFILIVVLFVILHDMVLDTPLDMDMNEKQLVLQPYFMPPILFSLNFLIGIL